MPELRKTTSDVEVGGRKWRINMFDARTGSYICLKLVSKMSGIFMAIASGDLKEEALLAMTIGREIGSFNRIEFTELQNTALGAVGEITMVGGVEAVLPVLQIGGEWGVPHLEKDLITVLVLTAHSLAFNLSPFFDGDALTQAMNSFQGLNFFNASTLTPSPMPQ